MKLHVGHADEYRRRHDAIWPELKNLLSENGIRDYSIFIDEQTHDLFGILEIDNPKKLNALSAEPVMKKWWYYMKDIMETNPDDSPLSTPLKEVFYLP